MNKCDDFCHVERCFGVSLQFLHVNCLHGTYELDEESSFAKKNTVESGLLAKEWCVEEKNEARECQRTKESVVVLQVNGNVFMDRCCL